MKIFYFVSIIITLAGCSRQTNQITVLNPEVPLAPYTNTLILNQGIDKIWANIVTKFTASSFAIGQIDEKMYFISVSDTTAPNKFIDCGTRTIDNGNTVQQITNTAGQYQYTIKRGKYNDTFKVQNYVTGKTSILIAGNESSSEITLHTTLNLETNVEYSTTQGLQHGNTEAYALQLTPGEIKFFAAYGSTCRSTGSYEHRVIEILQN